MGGGATRARAVAFIFGPLCQCYVGSATGARSSAGERLLHTQEVVGSNPAAPTTKTAGSPWNRTPSIMSSANASASV
jgi:hypothetical protein